MKRAMDNAADECLSRARAILLVDAWPEQRGNRYREILRGYNVKTLNIPPHTTPYVQFLDVGVFLQ